MTTQPTRKPSPAFQFYPADFIAQTATMSPAEVGLYARALCHLWNHRKLPTDPARLGRVLGASEAEMASCWPAIQPLVSVDGGAFESPVIEKTRVDQDEYREMQANKGRASGEARRNRGSTGVQPLGQPEANPSSSSSSVATPSETTPTPPSEGRTRKAWKPSNEATPDLCSYLGRAIKHWKPDAVSADANVNSKKSQQAMDSLLLRGASPERIREVADFLWGNEQYDYQPNNGFDWRRVVQSGTKFAEKFDVFEDMLRCRKAGAL